VTSYNDVVDNGESVKFCPPGISKPSVRHTPITYRLTVYQNHLLVVVEKQG